MRTTPGLRIPTAALLTAGTLAVTAVGTTAGAAPPTLSEGRGGDDPIWGTVVSRTALTVREAPTVHSKAVAWLDPGSQDRVTCKVRGQHVNGNPNWYWLVGAHGWASAAFVETDRHHVPACDDPCPRWKDGKWANWNEPDWARSWTVSGSFSASGSWSVSASGSSSGDWGWLPVVR